MDNKILAKVLKTFKEKLIRKEEIHNIRLLEINAKIPQISEIDKKIKQNLSFAALSAINSSENIENKISSLKDKHTEMKTLKEKLLLENGYPKDYLNFPYDCIACSDSGYIGTKICECTKKHYEKARCIHISDMLDTKNQNFDTFNISIFPNQAINGTNLTVRQNMEHTLNLCKAFCQNFSSENLLLTGKSGLGKTFISSCIADSISKQGYSVVYDSAIKIFSNFETEKFKTQIDNTKYFNADLLIIDDLGTEMQTSFTLSTLYNIINSRLLSKKSTIINTNISKDDVSDKYSPAIGSRLLYEYKVLQFVGNDLRNKSKS